MSNLIRFEPAHELLTLREAMDQLFDEAFTRPLAGMRGQEVPSIDMYQTDDDVVVRAALPGVKTGDVQISVTGDLLTLRGEMKAKADIQEAAYHLREQRTGTFERSVVLPTAVLPDKAKAEFEDGLLTITLPKVPENKPKTISVKVN